MLDAKIAKKVDLLMIFFKISRVDIIIAETVLIRKWKSKINTFANVETAN